nr:bifunctional diguanylate cyclase/phosphodiesterase [Alpinimonas psychrophila]
MIDAQSESLKSVSVAMILTNTDRKIVLVNDLAELLFGYSRAELLGRRIGVLMPERDGVAEAESTSGCTVEMVETKGRLKNGATIDISLSVSLVYDADGVKYGISYIVRDIDTTSHVTDHHLFETQRREAETNFQLSFDMSLIGMGMVDLDGRFQRVNLTLCEIFGRTENELLGKRARDFFPPEDARSGPRSSAHPRSGVAVTVPVERRYLRPDGGVIWAQEIISSATIVDGGHRYSLLQLQDITSRKQAEESLSYQLFHDTLTGLGNRLLLRETLERALANARESGRQVGVLFLDTDQFTLVNDGLGHSAGDQLLVQLARRLQAMVRPTDTVARFSGDEFVIVCEDTTVESVDRLVKRILASGKEPFPIGGHEVFATMSVGIIITNGDEDAGCVLRNADTAMYHAKHDGGGRAIVFRQEMHSTASSRLDLESQLRRALDNRELRVYYQPVVDIWTEDVVGFEALVRWDHPERGLILPLEFIPVAEETGMIIPIGEWVLRQALTQAQRWRTEAPRALNPWIAVNVSTLQLRDANFVGMVADVLMQTGFDPTALHLEITETGLMNDIGANLKTLHALRTLGVQLSIDDFGTGQSSLSYLSLLPVQTLKIGCCFIAGLGGEDPHASPIADVIVSVGRALKLTVIAEGVETMEQLQELRRIGSPLGQGFLWSQPLPSEKILEWLGTRLPRE